MVRVLGNVRGPIPIADYASGISYYYCARRNTSRDDRTCTQNTAGSDGYSRQNDHTRADPHVVSNTYRSKWPIPLLNHRDVNSRCAVVPCENQYFGPHHHVRPDPSAATYIGVNPDP